MAENSPTIIPSDHTTQNNRAIQNNTDDILDTQSDTSSASGLQMSMLENRLENEILKLSSMVKDTVSTLQNSITNLTERVEKKFSDIDERFNRFEADRAIFGNINSNRSSSLFGQAYTSNPNRDNLNPFSLTSSQNRVDNQPPIITHSSQGYLSSNYVPSMNTHNMNGGTTGCDLTRVTESCNRGGNLSGTNEQTCQSCSNSSVGRYVETKRGNHLFKMKPQNFDGKSDFDEFLCQFEINCEINAWGYKEKSLYLANCLTGDARSLLNELGPEGRRDYNTLIDKLRNRFGSVNRAEIFRTQLKSRTRNKGETIPELAQAIKKLVRQAYPGVTKDVIETLSLDNFIDAITDSDIRMRVRELNPKSLEEAEKSCVRLEAYKIADKQRSRLVGRLDSEVEPKKEVSSNSQNQFAMLSEAISTLTSEVKKFSKTNNKSTNWGNHDNQRNQGNNRNNNRYPRFDSSNQNNRNLNNGYSRYGNQNRGNNSNERNPNRNHGQTTRKTARNENQGSAQQNSTNKDRSDNAVFEHYPLENATQGNLNQSVWGATSRRQ
ncbi:MAG: hypothetical protein N0C90_19075 [Candidatus Thiodiazotropha endolucinida]|nr:hypothetical protein [Candidatus Thiodiazotropha taylori]MCW4263459.1 hypothetical protein [Candidatus Thiodiazotropha endolucinida]